MIIKILIFLLFFYVFNLFNHSDIKNRKDILTVWFGVPGSGKTTMAAYLVKSELKRIKSDNKKKKRKKDQRMLPVSNVCIKGARKLDCKDIGVYVIENCRMIIDEASIEFNNRKFKTLPQYTIEWFKLHRHCESTVDVFSQSYDDMDITLRRLAQKYYHLQKSIFPWFIKYRQIKRVVGIDKDSKQVADLYEYVPFSKRFVYCPTLWKMFNTLDAPKLKQKEWEIWT